MSIIDQLTTDFSHSVQRNGRDYFSRGAVRISHADEWSIHATVQGTDLYDVSIQWDGDNVQYECSCPFFTGRNELCKHLYATLLTAEDQGKLPSSIVHVEKEDDFGDDEEEPVIQVGFGHAPRIARPAPPLEGARPRHAVWRRRLDELKHALGSGVRQDPEPWSAAREILYIVDGGQNVYSAGLHVELGTRTAKKTGGWDKQKQLRLGRRQIALLPDPVDKQIVQMLAGMGGGDYGGYYEAEEIPRRYRLSDTSQEELIKMMCAAGRCMFRTHSHEHNPRVITWDDSGAWDLVVQVAGHDEGSSYKLGAVLRRKGEQINIDDASLIVPGGLVFIKNTVARMNDGGAFPFASQLRHDQTIIVPAEQGDDLLDELMTLPRLPQLDLPASLKLDEVRPAPRPRLLMHAPKRGNTDARLSGELSFQYEEQTIPYGSESAVVFQRENRRVIHRDLNAEQIAVAHLRDLGFRLEFDYGTDITVFRLNAKNLPSAVRSLIDLHWRVEVDGKLYRQPSQIKIEVSSGIDWFELHGSADFGGSKVALPALLKSLSKGETTVVLDDGTVGVLPEEWLKQYGLLGAMGTADEDVIKFSKSQVGLLDALLATQPMVQVDETFAKARSQLLQFEGVTAADPPDSFVGSLRPYQRDGLGWLNFLRTFGLNGCLADDMGLGKTVQVLALLDHRRILRDSDKTIGPSLVVVPRSLVFNWVQEAKKFAPKLKVLDHATADRLKTIDHFTDYDVVLTTYGTLRNDAIVLKDLRFDYVILDEAQAIKNASSETAKAARVLVGNYRLVLSGTPVQNHLGELWSLFEFLNPGMLGASRVFNMNGGAGRTLDEDNRVLLSRALKPFIMRRTKEQVAKDLPEKVEQTIFCELDKAQRALYDELREHYRQSLLTRIATEGINKSKIQVLEALLRLRQAACHPGLLDKSRIGEGSAKLDTLMPRLAEIAGEGHRAIVFSQFTSFLSIVRKRLDDEGTIYEYLDGKTRDRQQRVERFQTDEKCKLFLVSLKAGGVGLNLTAAQYVFLLDPWWNPAVEAQAIDRAHRIGQTKNVFAYRLIAKDTVEEKVLQLQQTKRDLADAIIKADNNLIAKLGREELELLLS